LAAAVAAGGALATQAVVRPTPVAAADVVLGAVNTATDATTIRNTQALNTAKAIVGLVTFTGAGPSTAGVQGQSNAANGNGVFGVSGPGAGAKGVWGRSASGWGVYGEGPGGYGVFGNGSYGVVGTSTSHSGIYGTGGPNGVYGRGSSNGVYGEAIPGQGGAGVFGRSAAAGVSGVGYYGLKGESSSPYGYGVYGKGPEGVTGSTDEGNGVSGFALIGDGIGVVGRSDGPLGCGVRGIVTSDSSSAAGVRGTAGRASAFAGFFDGKVHVAGNFSSANKFFLIDHPQDPANKTLTHSCVEAPEMLNVYRGNVTLDAQGYATVRLPRYFGALNADYSYQATPIGPPLAVLYIAREISRAGTFRIGGGAPGQKVCWQVTGVRHDAYARKHPLRVERAKKPRDRGKYLNPEAFGKPRSAAMHPVPKVPRLRRPRTERAAA
jgi:hypothetical protein